MLIVLPKNSLSLTVAAPAPTITESEIRANLPSSPSMGSAANSLLEISTRVHKWAKAGSPGRDQRWELEHLSADARMVKRTGHPANSASSKFAA